MALEKILNHALKVNYYLLILSESKPLQNSNTARIGNGRDKRFIS